MKKLKSKKFTVLSEVSLQESINLYGSDTFVSNFFCKRKVFTICSSNGQKYILLNTHKNIGPGKISLKFKEV